MGCVTEAVLELVTLLSLPPVHWNYRHAIPHSIDASLEMLPGASASQAGVCSISRARSSPNSTSYSLESIFSELLFVDVCDQS